MIGMDIIKLEYVLKIVLNHIMLTLQPNFVKLNVLLEQKNMQIIKQDNVFKSALIILISMEL
jgi:hypothetical protein